MDSLTGVPVRTWADDAAKNGVSLSGLLKAAKSIGTDPRNAPTGADVADHMGIENPYAVAAMATAVDMAGLPIPGGMLPGVAGKVADKADDAQRLLAKVATPEQAVALKGADREAYLQALDQVYGARAKRAKEMGFGDKTWYHGTANDFDQFAKDNLGAAGRDHGEAYFFAKNPEMANEFAEHSAIGKGGQEFIDQKDLVASLQDELADAESNHQFNKWHKINKTLEKETQKLSTMGGEEQVMPVRLRSNNKPATTEAYGSFWPEKMINDYLKKADDSLIIKNLQDSPAGLGTRGDVGIVKNPNQIRSTNSAFDPRFKDSPLLLAGHAGAAPTGPLAGLLSAQERQDELERKAVKAKRKKGKDK